MASKATPASRRGARSKKQTRLAFSPLPSSSPAKDRYSAAIRDRLANVTYDGAPSSPPRRGDDDEPQQLPTPGPSSLIQAEEPSCPLSEVPPTPAKRGASETAEQDDEDDVVPSSKRRRADLTSNAQETPVRRSSRLQNSSPPSPSSSHSSDVFSHVEIPTPTRRPSGLSDVGSAETSDEDVLVTQPTQRRRKVVQETYHEIPTRSSFNGRSTGADDWLVDDDVVEYISSDEDARPKPRRKQSKSRTREEQEELDADLDDLQDSDQQDSARKKRTRGGPVTTQRDKAREHFDLLKRRRAGERVPRIRDSDDEDSDEGGVDVNLIGRPAVEISDDESVASVDTNPLPEEADNEEDFIEDDTSGRLGRPDAGVPLEFTRFASAKPRELFPHIVEWLVKNKLAPAFTRHDPVYRLAFDRIDDQVRGQAGSRLISSAWNAEFKYTILARPDISITDTYYSEDRCCDACNRTNRPSRYDFVLSGDAYYKDSLEPVEYSDAGDEDGERDEGGHQLASQTHHFYLGSHCAANAQIGHKLSHWKYHLNEAILAYLEEQDVLSAEAIVARDKMNKKKREKEAEAIVDSMEEIGKVEELWKDFQNDLKDAMLGMEDYTRKGGRSKGRIGIVRSSGTYDGIIREWNNDKYKQTRRLDSDSHV